MLILLVPLLLILSGWAILILHRINRKSGTIWLISVLMGLLSLIVWGVIGLFNDTSILLDLSTRPFGMPAEISFTMDSLARGAGVFSLAYLVYVVNAWMAKLDQLNLFVRLKNFLVITAFALILYGAGNLFTWLLILIVMDWVELFHLFGQIRNLQQLRKSFTAILIRFAGTLLFMGGWLLSINLSDASIISKEVLYVAIMLRLFAGMFRINSDTNEIERVLGDFEEMPLFLVAHFLFFVRFPMGFPLPTWMQYLTGIGFAVMSYHLVQWLRVQNRSASLRHFLYFFVIFFLIYSQIGSPSGVLSLIFVFLLSLAMIYFRPISHTYEVWFTLPLFALLFGLPYLPTASYWVVNTEQFRGLLIIFAGFMLGFRSRFEQQKPVTGTVERWMLVLYPIGYIPLLVGIIYLVLVKDIPIQMGNIWLSSMLAALILVISLYTFLKQKGVIKVNESLQWVTPIFEMIWKRISGIFNQYWILRLVNFVSSIFERLILFFTGILEGDGGLLWSIVLLILFLSVMRSLQG